MKKDKNKISTQDFIFDSISDALDDIENDCGIESGDANNGEPLSSGILMYDLLTGGGLVPGFYVNSGKEGSGKTTIMHHILESSIKKNIRLRQCFAAENLNEEYACSVMRRDRIEVFGKRNTKGKGWIVKPKIRRYTTNVIEAIFKAIQETLKILPDKLYRREDDSWWYVFDKSQKDILEKWKLDIDKRLSRGGKYYCKALDGMPQAIIAIDSWSTLVVRDLDENADKSSRLGAVAGKLSELLPKITGKLASKRIIILGTSQIREKPMVMFGSPDYEPGGNALKHATDVRNKFSSRSVPSGWDGKGEIAEEKSAFGKGTDRYMYKFINNTKNKFSIPRLSAFGRVWISDTKGNPYGFDPVFDLYQYLSATGQIRGKKNKFTININKLKFKPVLNWMSFKRLILASFYNKKELIDIVKKELKIKEIPEFRKIAFKQIRLGKSQELYNETQANAKNEEDLEED